MTRAEIQTALKLPYDRARWLSLLKSLLPSVTGFAQAQPLPFAAQEIKSGFHIATIPLADGKSIAVLEIEVSGRVDLLRNRVGLRNAVASFIDQDKAHAVIGLFRGEGSADADYRLSFVARSSDISADGQLTRSQTDRRRYTYMLGRGMACRTAAERLDRLQARGTRATLDDFLSAFHVEPLFKEFFKDYRRVFDLVKDAIRPTFQPAPGDKDKDPLQMFTQRLFNRLMFLAFVERKGWLRLGQRTDYLAALWETRDPSAPGGFYRSRLIPLFFEGLNQPDRPSGHSDPRFGSVPYLNGGLFEKAEHGYDDNTAIRIPDEALAAILDASATDDSRHGLFARYNFTVAESTPLDVEVAVDPEMLGKVFEELVTGRNESGSFYTPKPIVSFMCREALVGHLASRCEKEERATLEAFVHDHQAGGLRDPEAVLAALRTVTVCDPACGSGAYLLGMLHELMDLRSALFASHQKLAGVTAHGRKLEIIERNLYGVDKDAFAVGIARLRLWLSLAVEYDGSQPPPPLPNLEFKIEQGDSLAAPAPAEVLRDAGSLPLLLPSVRDFAGKKAKFLTAHGAEKDALRAEITALKDSLKTWLATDGPADAFHWALEFAEVFIPQPPSASLGGELNLGLELAAAPATGGFDIVVANPPYVRMELIKPQKPVLRKRFPEVHAERADLFIYFYARAHDLLRKGGTAAFISSNKWLRAGYGEPLRQHLLDSQAFEVVMDFGELRVFEAAATDAAIFIWRKAQRAQRETRWAMVKDLDRCYAEGVRPHFLSLTVPVPAAQFGKGKPRLATSATADLRKRMERSGPNLGSLFPGLICWGIKTGLNDAFIIPQSKRDELVAETPAAAQIIKPLLAGDDIRRYETHYRSEHLIYARHGIDIRRYPSVEKHLQRFRSFKDEKGRTVGLDHRATAQEWFELQQPSPRLVPILEAPKLLYPIIGKECRFVIDASQFYVNDKVFILPSSDSYLLAVLNSASSFAFLKETCVTHGDKDAGGRLEFRAIYLETLPIPDASDADRLLVGGLAERAQALHGQRRARVERFLRDMGQPPEESTSRNPLEQPWSLTPEEFAKRAKPFLRTARERPQALYEAARGETAALTEQIAKVEAEIDARVAALYGLDAEDQRWAAKAAPAAQAPDKEKLFFHILGPLKECSPYFSHKSVQMAANEAELSLDDKSLNVYLHQAVKQGLIHDAGRGWYTRLSEPVRLDVQHVAKLVRLLERKFPLLDEFYCWNTVQVNPWMHHLIARGVTFVYTDADAMDAVYECLREAGYDAHLNPTGKAKAQFTVRENTVVVRRLVSGAPVDGHYARLETLLVDLWLEAGKLGLMDRTEFQEMAAAAVSGGRISVPEFFNYAANRKQKWSDLFPGDRVNQRRLFAKGDDN